MILVRLVFQAKFGSAGKTIETMKEYAASRSGFFGNDVRIRYLTDLSGPFDTIVQEIELGSLAQWEKVRADMFADPDLQEVQETMEVPFTAGRTEFYTIEGTYSG